MAWRGHQSDRRYGVSVPLVLCGLGQIGAGFWPWRRS